MPAAAQPGERTASCQRCGQAFGCGAATGGCWCQALDVPAAVGRRIASGYGDCLCPACLAELARPA